MGRVYIVFAGVWIVVSVVGEAGQKMVAWLYRRSFRRYTSAAMVTDRRPFTDDDVWKPFPFRDGEVRSEW
jgi:hypothetical protein